MKDVAIAIFCVAGVVPVGPAFGQILSPGKLSAAHADLDGIDNCLKCHSAGSVIAADRCLECHQELGERIADRRGFHGRMPSRERACGSCHIEHLGRDRKIIDWGPGGRDAFDHQKTGWPLRGKHRRNTCTDCHQKRLIQDDAVVALLREFPRKETFLGLGTLCQQCHFDEHRGQLGQACRECHDERHFKPATRFDHGRSDFPLTGQHTRVACEKCHPRIRDTRTRRDAFPAPMFASFMQMVDIPHASCSDCHEDVHNGRFGQDCESCHVTRGWKVIKPGVRDTSFHDAHRFPLRGKHARVPCKSCHGPFPGRPAVFRGLEFKECTSCHYDSHLGQLKVSNNGRRSIRPCDDCHAETGFLPTGYEFEDHQKTSFPLEGAHASVPCNLCHIQRPRFASRIPRFLAAKLRREQRPQIFSFAELRIEKFGTCNDCHQDVHGGQFVRTTPKKACEDCHRVDSWFELSFDHDRDTDFPLTGAHREATCNGCHWPDLRGPRGKPIDHYRGVDPSCSSCHFDVHLGQLAQAGVSREPRTVGETNCERCHDTEDWSAEAFDHNDPKMAQFPLEGKHAQAECETCHQKVRVNARTETDHYKPLPTTCAGCHRDYHEGALREVPQ